MDNWFAIHATDILFESAPGSMQLDSHHDLGLVHDAGNLLDRQPLSVSQPKGRVLIFT